MKSLDLRDRAASRAGFLVVIVGMVLFGLTFCGFPEPRVSTDNLQELPDVVGKPLREAQLDLHSKGFLTVVDPTGSPPPDFDPENCPDAQVVAQDPPGGQKVIKATTVRLTIEGCP